MATPRRPTTVEIIHCEICMTEIPASEGMSSEALDYVMHFCGLECYDLWSKQELPKVLVLVETLG